MRKGFATERLDFLNLSSNSTVMSDILTKYNSLDRPARKQVRSLLNSLARTNRITAGKKKESYKKKILAISQWTKKDTDRIITAQKNLRFNVEQW